MTMTSGLRKFALTTHVTSSVGWLGAVGAFLALAIAGVGSQEAQIVRAAYLSMHLTTWFVIVPFEHGRCADRCDHRPRPRREAKRSWTPQR